MSGSSRAMGAAADPAAALRIAEEVVRLAEKAGLSEAEAQAYAAPYPDARYKAGVRRFPNLVPDAPDAPGAALSRRARDWWRSEWTGASFMAVGMKDPVLGPPTMAALRAQIRACPAPMEVADAGHFVQESGAVIVERALSSFQGV